MEKYPIPTAKDNASFESENYDSLSRSKSRPSLYIYHTPRKNKPTENNPHGKYPWEKTWENTPSVHRKIW